jgi:hypothetical protein
MFLSAEIEASSDGLSALATHRHVSSEAPTTRLLILYDRSRSPQARRTSCLAAFSRARVPHTQMLIPALPNFVGEGWMGQLGPRDIRTVASHR